MEWFHSGLKLKSNNRKEIWILRQLLFQASCQESKSFIFSAALYIGQVKRGMKFWVP